MTLEDHMPTSRGRAFIWGGIGLGALLVVLLFTKGFGLFGAAEQADDRPALIHQGDRIIIPYGSPLRSRLATMPVRSVSGSPQISLPALVESDPARTASVLPQLGGRVLQLKVALGDRVTKGQILAIIDSADLAQAYDDNDKAADTFALTKKNFERQQDQFKIGGASAKDADQAKSDFAQAAAEFTRTQARLNALGESAAGKHRSRLLVVSAPVSGSVTALSIVPGTMINDPTQSIMTIADLSTVWVSAMVPEADLSAVARNETADVKLDAYPGSVLHGKVLFVADVVDTDTHRTKLRIAFSNPDYRLKPNMFGTVLLNGASRPHIVLPTSALLMNNDTTSVFVATAPWTFERRIVDPDLEEGTTVTINSGLKPGDEVVVRGGILLND
ncbi:MAG: efflux RND transporter periplasmic adaptor subunit [Rhizomicrobium sp.]|jgi:cobalt-zinc-cadmium efflux system membrane fusion protein